MLVCVAACQNCMSPAWRCSVTHKQRWDTHYFAQSAVALPGDVSQVLC